MANTTIIVSNSSQLSAALKSATGGETIVLNSGNYGSLSVSNLNFSSEVTIVSANPDNMAVFSTVNVSYSSNVTFDSIEVDYHPTASSYSHDSAFMVNRSSDISIVNSVIEGELASTTSNGNAAGYAAGRGVTIQYSDDVKLDGNVIDTFGKGVVLHESEQVEILNGSIENVRTSHIVGADVHDVTVDGNYFGASNPYGYGGSNDHGDNIHFWIDSSQSEDSANITITNNFFDQSDGFPIMGVYIEDHGNTAAKFENVVIDNNVMHLGHRQAILIEGADGVQVTNNTMLPSVDDPKNSPGINFSLATKNVVVTDNVISAPIAEYTDDIGILKNSNNYYVQESNSGASNYIGKLFVDAMSGNPDLDDLQPVKDLGAGADLTEVGPGTTHDNGSDDNSTPDDSNETPDTPDDTTDSDTETPDDSNETPDNSDDDTNTGNNGNGGDDTTGSNDPVETDDLIRANMNGDANNAADPNSDDETVSNSVSFVKDGNREAVKLNDGAISYDNTGQFLNNDAYTLSFDFKKEAGAENASGYAIYFSSSFVVKINSETITAMVQTSNGTNWVNIDNIDIHNTDWHQFTLTFSGDNGEAVFYVDGVEAATVTGLDGAVQTGNQWHDFFVGGEYGGSFNGLIDNVSFAQGAINGDQAEELYKSMVENTDGSTNDDGQGTDDTNDDDQGTDDTTDDTTDETETPDETDTTDDDTTPDPQDPDETETGNDDTDTGDSDTDTGDSNIPDLDDELEIAALDQAATAIGDGILNLGRGDEYFGQDDFTASVTFALDDLDAGRGRLLWNHMNYGIQVQDDDLMVYFAEDGQRLQVYTFKDAIKDTDWHDVQLVLDDEADTFSIYFDGELLQSQSGVTGGVADPKWWDVTVGGTAFQNNDDFQGRIADFSIIDESLDIDSGMSVFERTAYIDAHDDLNSSNLDVIGVALVEDSLDFA
ncbi:hypothetical protein GQF03_16640 [Sneathiella chungangensis]|uniref:Right handed beta helix domain-containing protein n=1 Tax=Sneathiella chungangensis TaxID=1418234 RepID=A0A845MNK3_9PROT|nr:LamG-like jellyroll fold domain-containing protein [Sneathiella chungangensis]MZR23964.1 hypothetical protein [Sneathiella chungangensis]